MSASDPGTSGTALFDAVVRHYGDALYRFVRRMVGDGAVDDVMQDSFIKIYEALPRFEPSGSLRGYVFTIARNAARDYWKYESRRRAASLEFEPAAPAPSGRDDQWRAVWEAVRDLPEDQREVFLLREEGDLSFSEIARITGAPLNTVLGRMHYAMNSLKARFHELPRR